MKTDRVLRIFVGLALPASVVLVFLYSYLVAAPLPCIFRAVTGLYCPSCGATRAVMAMAHFDFLRALHSNALFVILIPAFAYYLLYFYVYFVFGKKPCKLITPPLYWLYILAAAVLLFFVLRNIDVYPLTLLNP